MTSCSGLNFKVAKIGIYGGLQKANLCIYNQIFITTQKMAAKSISYNGYTEITANIFLAASRHKNMPANGDSHHFFILATPLGLVVAI